MRVRFLLLAMFIFLFWSAGTSYVSAQTCWFLHAHCSSDRDYGYTEALMVRNRMVDEAYYGKPYYAYVMEDNSRSQILSTVDDAKVWHFAGHGNLDVRSGDYMISYLVTRDGGRIYGSDLPPLNSVYGGGPMLLAYCSSCYSGYDGNPTTLQLNYKFREKGAKAHIGLRTTLACYTAFQFADYFYYQLERAKTIQQSYDYACSQTGLSDYFIKLKGDGSQKCADI